MLWYQTSKPRDEAEGEAAGITQGADGWLEHQKEHGCVRSTGPLGKLPGYQWVLCQHSLSDNCTLPQVDLARLRLGSLKSRFLIRELFRLTSRKEASSRSEGGKVSVQGLQL